MSWLKSLACKRAQPSDAAAALPPQCAQPTDADDFLSDSLLPVEQVTVLRTAASFATLSPLMHGTFVTPLAAAGPQALKSSPGSRGRSRSARAAGGPHERQRHRRHDACSGQQ
jgi:hypothetical protein